MEKNIRQTSPQGSPHREYKSLSKRLETQEALSFLSSCNHWVWKLFLISINLAQAGHWDAFGEKTGQTDHRHTAQKQQPEDHQGHTVGRLFAHVRACSREAAFTQRHFQEQKNVQVSFSSPSPQDKHRTTCGNQCSADTPYLTSLYQSHLLPNSSVTALLSYTCFSPRVELISHQYYISQPKSFSGSHFLWE